MYIQNSSTVDHPWFTWFLWFVSKKNIIIIMLVLWVVITVIPRLTWISITWFSTTWCFFYVAKSRYFHVKQGSYSMIWLTWFWLTWCLKKNPYHVSQGMTVVNMDELLLSVEKVGKWDLMFFSYMYRVAFIWCRKSRQMGPNVFIVLSI